MRPERDPISARRSAPSGRAHRGRKYPFVFATATANGLMVTAANAAARRAGVQVNMRLADARAVCPGLKSEEAQPDRDAAALKSLAFWLGRYGPNRNVDGADGLWIETSGVDHLYGGEDALLQDIVARCRAARLTARVGLAETYGAAHALARYACAPDRPYMRADTGEVEEALASLPVEGLRLTSDSVLLLKRLGLRRIGQLYAIPRAALMRRFRDEGRAGRRQMREALARAVVWRLDQASGRIKEPRTPLEAPPLRTCRQSFTDPLISATGIEAAVIDQIAGLIGHLEAEGAGILELCVRLYRSDGTVADVAAGTSRPSLAPDHVFRLIKERLDTVDAGLGIDLVTVSATRTAPVTHHQGALVTQCQVSDNRVRSFAGVVDRLSNKIGADCVLVATAHETHVPERSESWASALLQSEADAPASTRAHAPSKAAVKSHVWGGGTPGQRTPTADRPALLLPRPERIDVLADLPEGAPARFRWRRRPYKVSRAEGPERITPEWWRYLQPRATPETTTSQSAVADLQACSGSEWDREADQHLNPEDQSLGAVVVRATEPRPRDYYMLEDEAGARFWVFRDGLYQDAEISGAPDWYVHGLGG
ncbi:MAG: DNA polymerase Y family protein [Pseudomonadota bacterium]